jgi:hypothetical protein
MIAPASFRLLVIRDLYLPAFVVEISQLMQLK